jgi:hypothetical protein
VKFFKRAPPEISFGIFAVPRLEFFGRLMYDFFAFRRWRSVGACAPDETSEQFVIRIDKALLRAKTNGKNIIVPG